ncbi:MAG: ABC transporter permease [Caldilinea sp.]|nr:ABC transporter permease [Caldilinea sp.]MDW8441234.1 ABC transporter permease [Caldilineaceae bacterium]
MKLAQYIVQRVFAYFLVLFVGITITFFLPRLMPGDPINNYISQVQARAGQSLSAEAVQQLRDSLAELYGLQGNLFTQYINYLKRVVRLDFGPSFTYYPEPVSEILLESMPWTAGLLLTTTLLSWLIGNGIGLIAGYYNKRRAAAVLEFIGIVLYPIPYYILALVVILILAYWLGLFPLSPTFLPGPISWNKVVSILYNSFLPALTLVLAGFGWNVLSMKALAIATKEDSYVQFARLKGTTDRTRMVNYVFRNAMLPQITALVLSLGFIFNGALQTEIIFSYPGLGMTMRAAAGAGDYNLLYGSIVITILSVATAALVLDLIYPLFDPRIRLGR